MIYVWSGEANGAMQDYIGSSDNYDEAVKMAIDFMDKNEMCDGECWIFDRDAEHHPVQELDYEELCEEIDYDPDSTAS